MYLCIYVFMYLCTPYTIDLDKITQTARNAEYNPKRFQAVIMRIREPRTTALIFASGMPYDVIKPIYYLLYPYMCIKSIYYTHMCIKPTYYTHICVLNPLIIPIYVY
jgi:hypothetical protein